MLYVTMPSSARAESCSLESERQFRRGIQRLSRVHLRGLIRISGAMLEALVKRELLSERKPIDELHGLFIYMCNLPVHYAC